MSGDFMVRLGERIPAEQRLRLRRRIARLRRPAWLGTLRRLTPLGADWGLDRGTPVDRYYIEQFLQQERQAIRGAVLEVKDRTYTQRFGAGVERSEILDIDPANPLATIVADLASANTLPSGRFDCFVLTQTLQLIPDIHAAIAHAYRLLRPGGVLLATLPGLCQVERAYAASDYWRLTPASCQLLFAEAFGEEHIAIRSYGNMLAAIAFLTGMASEELSQRELEFVDRLFPIVVAVRAEKTGAVSADYVRES
ncbi:MAG: methyltransferase domain-containing protein [Chloroflexi bacterium]|nr:methyltransferase domain-containing protein [Chloroflexota bacterium]